MNANGSIAIIPARFNSTRLPGKPLKEIQGRTLIEHVYRRVEMARGLDRILVATDDERIRQEVERFGGDVVLTRTDHQSGTDRLAEAVADLPDDLIVVNVQGDEPLIEPEVIDRALEAARMRDADVVTLMTPLTDPDSMRDPNRVKVVVDLNGFAMYFSRSLVPSSGKCSLHLGLYAYRVGFIKFFATLEPTPLEREERLEQLRILEHGFKIRVVEVESESWGIDTPADLEEFERMLGKPNNG
jgi:3-deoxy-manno-octulosonate cytidylyltransferase (CMP-KDO synthetase)